MFYTVKIYEHGMAFFGDPSWGHIASTVAHQMEVLQLPGGGCLAPHKLTAALAKVENQAPALVVCWTTMSRDAWLEELRGPQAPGRTPWPTTLTGWDTPCEKDQRGHDWKAWMLRIEGSPVEGAICDSECGAACRPEDCRWDELPWGRDPGSVDDLVEEG